MVQTITNFLWFLLYFNYFLLNIVDILGSASNSEKSISNNINWVNVALSRLYVHIYDKINNNRDTRDLYRVIKRKFSNKYPLKNMIVSWNISLCLFEH